MAQSKLHSMLQDELGFPDSAFFSAEPAAVADAVGAVHAWLHGERLEADFEAELAMLGKDMQRMDIAVNVMVANQLMQSVQGGVFNVADGDVMAVLKAA